MNSENPTSSLIGRIVHSDDEAMALALGLATEAAVAGEVPIGALLVQQGRVISAARNASIEQLDPSAHAEMLAIRQAAIAIGNYRLTGSTLYVTLEPCTMCFGLLVHSRIDRLVYGAAEPKSGAIHSALRLPEEPVFNHSFEITAGVLANECSQVMSDFFARRRAGKKRLKSGAGDPTDDESPA